MRVKLSTSVSLTDIHLCEIANTSDLNIIGCLDKMNAFEGAVGDDASSTAGFSAPGDLFTFGVADVAVSIGRSETEIHVSIFLRMKGEVSLTDRSRPKS